MKKDPLALPSWKLPLRQKDLDTKRADHAKDTEKDQSMITNLELFDCFTIVLGIKIKVKLR